MKGGAYGAPAFRTREKLSDNGSAHREYVLAQAPWPPSRPRLATKQHHSVCPRPDGMARPYVPGAHPDFIPFMAPVVALGGELPPLRKHDGLVRAG
jgi:hypothetical protein